MLTKPRIVRKNWGRELWLHNSPMYCGKVLEVMDGRGCGIHYHERKHETFYVLEGRLMLDLGGVEHIVEPGSVVEVQPYVRHRFRDASRDGLTRVLEVSTQHVETDTVRIRPAVLGYHYGHPLYGGEREVRGGI